MSTRLTATSLDYLIRQSPAPLAFVNKAQKCMAVSEAWSQLFGSAHEDIVGKDAAHLFGSATGQWAELHLKCVEKPTTYSFQDELGISNEKHIEFTIKPWFDAKENLVGTITYAKEVTSLVALEKETKELRSILDATAEISRVGTWEYDLRKDQLFWSKMTRKIHQVPDGYKPNIARAVAFYKQGFSRNTVSMLFHQALEYGKSYNERLQIISHKNQELWVTTAAVPIYNNGRIVKLVGTIQDITAQVEAELQIKESEQLFHTLIDNLPINIFIKNKDFKKILVNKAECRFVGADNPKQVIGKTDFELFTKNMAQISLADDQQVMKTLKPILGKETLNIRKDGTKTYFLTSKIPLLDDTGQAKALMGISIDISDLKQKQLELKELIHVTAQQNKKLLNFAHIVSHNLRSHSANFAMLLKFLRNETDGQQRKRIIKMLSEASDSLMITLNDLNAVVDINTNLNLIKEPLDVLEYFNKVKQKLAAAFRKSGALITAHIPADTIIWAVPDYLENILNSLMTNALKYQSEKRQLKISVKVEKSNGVTLLAITDNGLGINLKKHGHKLFGMYKTFHTNKDSRGFGLYMVKNQMEAMGGDIMVESEEGYGSTFNLYFNEKKN